MTDILLIDRPLTDPERSLLAYLSVQTIVEQTSFDWQTVVDALKDCAGRGEVTVCGDAVDVRLKVCGRVLVHCTREWLSFYAHAPEWDQDTAPEGMP
jgi:hypothetical protein